MNRTILVAEDDADILNLLKLYLESSGFHVLIAADGEAAWQLIQTERVDLAILDVMMPRMDGFALTQKIRSTYNMPVLLLTARTGDTDKILGLNLGADDYMTKPFNPLEVVARVNANLRRFYQLNPASAETKDTVIRMGELELDTQNRVLLKRGAEIVLTPNEYKLLAYLMQSPGRVYTKSQLCTAINGEYYDNFENAMMVHISHLREKIEDDPRTPRYIKNVRGVGYKLEKSNKRGSVFTLLLRNYILLTLLLVVLLTALFAGLVYNMGQIVSGLDPSRIAAYDSLLAEQRYGDFPIESLLGRDGGIQVLDAQQQPVYQAGETLPLDGLSAADLACIPDFAAAPEITRQTFVNAEGERQTAILMQEKQNGRDAFRTYILGESGRILYQPGDLPLNMLNDRQRLLLSDSFSETHSIRKHAFCTDAGEHYTLLLMGDPARPETADTLVRSVAGFALAFLLIFCTVTLGFVLVLNQKINKPLRLLHQELNRFERGEILQTDYHGPKEFVEIFESFDDMAQRLRRSEEARRKLEEERQKMLADISHDLRTPIAVVQGYAAALRDGVIPPDQQGQYLSIIEQKASGLSDLINTFYEYSQMEHPDYALKLVPGDVCNTLRDYVADRYAELEVAGFAVEVDIPEKHILCGMDVPALRRALDNIVNNAIRHNPAGTKLSVSLTRAGDAVRILLADNGEGIPAELRPNIFTPFVVGEASRSKQGSGLGLSIAKKIIEAHHGSISLMDAAGTTFEILLPAI